MLLTGNKIMNMEILNKLDDKDLVNICQVNKKANEICRDQVFWMSRVFSKFPYVPRDILGKNKGNRSWSEYYIKDLIKIKKSNANRYLRIASTNDRLDHVIISVNLGADINDLGRPLGYSLGLGLGYPLKNAVYWDNFEIVKYLVNNGANIHVDNDFALKTAIKDKNSKMIAFLIDNS